MQIFASLMGFPQSAVFLTYLICNFVFINVCLYTVPPSVVWSSPQSTSLRIMHNNPAIFSPFVILDFSASFLLFTVLGMNPDRDKRFFSSPKCPYQLWGPTCLPFNGHLGSFLGIKRLECEANHSPRCSGEVSGWIYISSRL
jgi:hypothetical protein